MDGPFKNTVKICEKALLTVEEMMVYTGWGENTVRQELNHPKCSYVIRKGNRMYFRKVSGKGSKTMVIYTCVLLPSFVMERKEIYKWPKI